MDRPVVVEWERLTAPDLRRIVQGDPIVIVPVGATEQHGPHLPVAVDTMLVAEVAGRAARLLAQQAQPTLVVPPLAIGRSDHHVSLGGTLSLRAATFRAVLRDVVRSLRDAGVRRVLVLNGHGGNIDDLDALGGERWAPVEVVTATYFRLAAPAFAGLLERQEGLMHACEAETSMVLALAPELVDRDAAGANHFELVGPLPRDAAGTVRSFGDFSPTGIVGDPRAASAAKGWALLDAAVTATAAFVLDPVTWVRAGSVTD